ncbi:hypothetical protein PR202_ga03394 [Eleusine coracana subsp. coracana]|uniref:Metallo-beta-lactamase domain-containing protein n=1 Tax=Eleusine coracana subsp. coracana TaxID=191504 RepID=A0AAV5BP05_ELECO|nr:hypothetical protein PR202_ga03394 [Eleusine coracana subsp. coracana]
MSTSLRAAASFSAAPPLPRRRVAQFRATATQQALNRRRRPQNVPGEFFVDHRCIDCQTCRWMAPEVFKRVDGKAAVAAQPSSEEERTKALQGVYLCGYHSEDSYGATSYLVTHPQGNILIDSYRELPEERNFTVLKQVEEATADVEWKLNGSGPWNIGTDFELIYTPGHTEVLFTGDHIAKSEESDDLDLSLIYNKQSVSLQLDNIRKLLEVDFEWILPGHGHRIWYEDERAKNSAIESLLANYTS